MWGPKVRRGRQPIVRVPQEQAEVRRDRRTGTRRSPRSARRRCCERVIRGPEQHATIAIEGVRPDVDCGRYAVKRTVGDNVVVTADVFSHGHTELAVQLEYRHQTGRTWKPVPMQPLGNDRWTGTFPAERVGEYRFRIVAWPDELATWRRDFAKKLAARVDTDLDREEGALLAEQQVEARDHATAPRWRRGSSGCAAVSTGRPRRVSTAWWRRPGGRPTRRSATVFAETSPVWVDRPRARTSAWYELSPAPRRPTRSGRGRLPT